jgi:hypothetical protein
VQQGLLPNLKLTLPDKFNGDVSKLRSWIFGIRQYGQISGLTDEQLAAVAVTLLQGKAKIWWETLASGGSV